MVDSLFRILMFWCLTHTYICFSCIIETHTRDPVLCTVTFSHCSYITLAASFLFLINGVMSWLKPLTQAFWDFLIGQRSYVGMCFSKKMTWSQKQMRVFLWAVILGICKAICSVAAHFLFLLNVNVDWG